MDDGLRNVRGRCAYWEKRLALEPRPQRRRELERQAWTEIVRLAIQHGNRAQGITALHELVDRLMVEEELRQHGVTLPATASRRQKSKRARAAKGGHSKATA